MLSPSNSCRGATNSRQAAHSASILTTPSMIAVVTKTSRHFLSPDHVRRKAAASSFSVNFSAFVWWCTVYGLPRVCPACGMKLPSSATTSDTCLFCSTLYTQAGRNNCPPGTRNRKPQVLFFGFRMAQAATALFSLTGKVISLPHVVSVLGVRLRARFRTTV